VVLPNNLFKNAIKQPLVVSIIAFSLFIVVRLLLVFAGVREPEPPLLRDRVEPE
jgi:hypothetical protein